MWSLSTREQARARRGWHVSASHRLLLGAVIRNREGIATTSVRVVRRIRNWKELQELERKRAEERRIDLVIDERRTKLLRRATATGRGHDPAEVAAQHLPRRNNLVGRLGRDVLIRQLHAGKEEHLVFL